MQEKLVSRAKELLSDGTVVRVLGWRKGDTDFSAEPAFFETAESLSEFTYDGFCGANLSKYMIKASKEEGKTLVFLKPCDTYSFNQLIKEHRVDREKTYIVGIGCDGKLDIEKIREAGSKGITRCNRRRRYHQSGNCLRRQRARKRGCYPGKMQSLQGRKTRCLRRAGRELRRRETGKRRPF